jgi:peptide/nickel transport system permease protein
MNHSPALAAISTYLHADKKMNRRKKTLILIGVSLSLLILIFVSGNLVGEAAIGMNLSQRNLTPSPRHLFGTDWLGRDVFQRTLKGLSLSVVIGIFASVISSIMGALLGIAAAVGGKTLDRFILWLTDVFMGMPHLIFLILISFAFGKGAKGIAIGVILTHWTRIIRVIRAEVLQIKITPYITAARNFGKSSAFIAFQHIIPHILPSFTVGLILLFPHAILHESAMTFLGFGLASHQPGIGVMLSEAMGYLSTGQWWVALMPGLSLLLLVRLFDILGEEVQRLLNPYILHE